MAMAVVRTWGWLVGRDVVGLWVPVRIGGIIHVFGYLALVCRLRVTLGIRCIQALGQCTNVVSQLTHELSDHIHLRPEMCQ